MSHNSNESPLRELSRIRPLSQPYTPPFLSRPTLLFPESLHGELDSLFPDCPRSFFTSPFSFRTRFVRFRETFLKGT